MRGSPNVAQPYFAFWLVHQKMPPRVAASCMRYQVSGVHPHANPSRVPRLRTGAPPEPDHTWRSLCPAIPVESRDHRAEGRRFPVTSHDSCHPARRAERRSLVRDRSYTAIDPSFLPTTQPSHGSTLYHYRVVNPSHLPSGGVSHDVNNSITCSS